MRKFSGMQLLKKAVKKVNKKVSEIRTYKYVAKTSTNGATVKSSD